MCKGNNFRPKASAAGKHSLRAWWSSKSHFFIHTTSLSGAGDRSSELKIALKRSTNVSSRKCCANHSEILQEIHCKHQSMNFRYVSCFIFFLEISSFQNHIVLTIDLCAEHSNFSILSWSCELQAPRRPRPIAEMHQPAWIIADCWQGFWSSRSVSTWGDSLSACCLLQDLSSELSDGYWSICTTWLHNRQTNTTLSTFKA